MTAATAMRMVSDVDYDLAHQLASEGVRDSRVLAAVMRVDRTAFVPEAYRGFAHRDEPLPIGHGQTISQPYVVAAMTTALDVKPGDRVLEVGTGSGYQAAVLAELGCEVYSIERIKDLAEAAALALVRQGYKVHLRVGDGALGWPDEAPFDGIIVTAATSEVPQALMNQLKKERRLVLPLGDRASQRLCVVTWEGNRTSVRDLFEVRFVPLVT